MNNNRCAFCDRISCYGDCYSDEVEAIYEEEYSDFCAEESLN